MAANVGSRSATENEVKLGTQFNMKEATGTSTSTVVGC